uniref:Protein phosphatase n=1 Tax=Craspedostauros australis TaxID=1486917 RepID=A0A7R9ZSY9_9STRA
MTTSRRRLLLCTLLAALSATRAQPGAYFRHKTVLIPHDDKKFRGGEDAASTSDTMLVVADGVGGWARHGVNPGLFSRKLTSTVLKLDEENTKNSTLVEIVHTANWRSAREHLGSATCTVVKIQGWDTISTLNVGDSGYAHFRVAAPADDGDDDATLDPSSLQLLFESVPGQKGFNYPYQLGGKNGDQVADAAVLADHKFEHGDVIVTFSDGVSDNLFIKNFDKCLLSYMDKSAAADKDWANLFTSYSLPADCIARTAYFLGKDPTLDSPFAQGARKIGKRYHGGKHDDITVTVAQVFIGDPTDAETMGVVEDDPHYSDSIHIYTGPVGTVEDLPKPAPRKPVAAHTEL